MLVGRSEMVVAIGFAEALSAPEVAWSLVDAGFRVVAFARKGQKAALRHSHHVETMEITPPEKDCTAALADLAGVLDVCAAGVRSVLLPLDDASVWLCDRVRPRTEWVVAGPTGDRAELALDKRRQFELAASVGLAVPPTAIVRSKAEIAGAVEAFPVILRPALATTYCDARLRKGRNYICADENELEKALAQIDDRLPMTVQPFLTGTGEGVFGLATEHGVFAWSAHRRLRMMNPHGSGSSACISRSVPDDVREPIAKFVRLCGWRGMFMVEMLRTDDGCSWFVEFNGRAWGSMALSRRQSLEYPAWTVKQAIDPALLPISASVASDGIECRNLGREVMHLAFVMRGPRSRAVRHWPSAWRTLLATCCFGANTTLYNWRREDWRVFIMDCWYTVRNQLLKST